MFTVRIYHMGITVSRGVGIRRFCGDYLVFKKKGGEISRRLEYRAGGGGERGLEKIDC